MSDEKIHELLEQLRHEIEQVESVDDRGRELLRAMDADIHDLLARSAKPGPSMFKRMEDSMEYLEVTHPRLTELLSELLASLSNAGI